MKKFLFSIVLSAFSVLMGMAVPANPTAAMLQQPDGTYITVMLHGDEFVNFSTTTDGYSVVKGTDGYWRYAVKSNGVLAASSVIAHDADARTATDNAFLSSTQKYLAPEASVSAKAMRTARKAMKPMKLQAGQYDYNKFRGLVILVEFSDRSFLRDDAAELFADMINTENYTGYTTDAQTPEFIAYQGSVHDYFRDNSNGMFAPEFDVIGPVKIDASQTSPNQANNAQSVVKMVLEAADDLVDYSVYDSDGNNEVDMVYFIFAGGGSNYTGNNQSYVWPHASSVNSQTLDGVRFGRYACSTELYGPEDRGIIDGIGTVVHEFSHVLGLPDEYDTDYTGSGGQSVHPNQWSVMSSGCYLNLSRTPCGYSLYERYSAGFSTPTVIEDEGSFTLNPLNTSNEGYRINSGTDNEYFLLENRQKTGWDAYLPGHGMLVFRVDSTNATVWANNNINVNPSHNYYELLRATPNTSTSGTVTDSGGDPFPGTGGIGYLNNSTTPNLCSWTGTPTPIVLSGITESDDGVITFDTNEESLETDVEDFEDMALTTADTTDIVGKFCSWTLESATIDAPDGGVCNGKQAVGMVRGGSLTTSNINKGVRLMSFNLNNPTSNRVILRCYYSYDNGDTWTILKTNDGAENTLIASKSEVTLSFRVNQEAGVMYRITEYGGSTDSKCYIDDVAFVYDSDGGGSSSVRRLTATGLKFGLNGNVLSVGASSDGGAISVFAADGTRLASRRTNGDGLQVSLPSHGVYIVKQGNVVKKIAY